MGGAETQVFLLARSLAARGAKIRLIAFDVPGHRIPDSVDGVSVALRAPYRAHDRLGRLREIVALFRAVAGSRADVVVTRAAGPHVGLVAMAARLSRRRFVYSSANLSDFDFELLEPRSWVRSLFRVGVRLAETIVVQTEEQVALCRERFGRDAVRISSIAEPAGRRRGKPEAFLWIGRVVWYKRPLAYVELARSLPDARFWMIPVPVAFAEGGEELEAELAREAATAPNLELLPPMPRERLAELFDRCVAIVSTSDFEGMPNVFLEAWARGVPALSLSHDPDGVIARHGLGAFADGSPEKLEELADAMWRGREAQAEIAERCAGYVLEQHSPDAVAARWLEALGIRSSSATERADTA